MLRSPSRLLLTAITSLVVLAACGKSQSFLSDPPRPGRSGMSTLGDRTVLYELGDDRLRLVVVCDLPTSRGSRSAQRGDDWTSWLFVDGGELVLRSVGESLFIGESEYDLRRGRVFCARWKGGGRTSSAQLDLPLRRVRTSEAPDEDWEIDDELERVSDARRVDAALAELGR